MHNDHDDFFTEDRKDTSQEKPSNVFKAVIIIAMTSSIAYAAYAIDITKYLPSLSNIKEEADFGVRDSEYALNLDDIPYAKNATKDDRKTSTTNCISWSKPSNQYSSSHNVKSTNDLCLQSGSTQESARKNRNRAKNTNTKTCLYWSKKYKQERSNYNQLMRNDACKRAGYNVDIKTVNHYPTAYRSQSSQGNSTTVAKNNCQSLTVCKRYRSRLDNIQGIMRHGYEADQYNYLEGKRRNLREKIYDNCKCYAPSNY